MFGRLQLVQSLELIAGVRGEAVNSTALSGTGLRALHYKLRWNAAVTFRQKVIVFSGGVMAQQHTCDRGA